MYIYIYMSDGLNLLHPRKDMAEMVIVFCVPPSFLRVWCCGHEMSKWLKRRSSKSRSSRTSSNRRKNSSSHEKGMVSYQQGSRFRALSLWGFVCKDWETKKMVIVQSSFWSSFWAAFHFRIFEVCSCSAWYLLLLAHSFWMLLEAWFHADINLLDECLQIQNQANMYIKSHRFLCHPYRSWEIHDHIKYHCPGVTVPNGRRFWRALIYYCKMLLVHQMLHLEILLNKLSKCLTDSHINSTPTWRHEPKTKSCFISRVNGHHIGVLRWCNNNFPDVFRWRVHRDQCFPSLQQS